MFTVELRRSMLGLPTHVLIRHRKKGHAVASFEFHPPEPVHPIVQDWALYRDWSEELVIFTDLRLAGELQQMVERQPPRSAPAWGSPCPVAFQPQTERKPQR